MKKEKILDFLKMTFGTIILSVGIYFFKIPNNFSTGGVSGVGMILGSFTKITPATWILILNVLLLIIGFVILGKDTGKDCVLQYALFCAYQTS